MKIKIASAAAALAMGFASAASAALVGYSDFNPYNNPTWAAGSDTGSLGPTAFGGIFPTLTGPATASFIAPVSYNVTQIDLPISFYGIDGNFAVVPSDGVEISLESGPTVGGATLGSWKISVSPTNFPVSLTTISPISGIKLTSGNPYILVAQALGNTDLFWDTCAVHGDATCTSVDPTGVTVPAYVGYQPAFDVLGTAVTGVPEPSVWAMLLTGFAGLGLALRRRHSGTSAQATA